MKNLLLIVSMLLVSTPIFAATVHLNDGRTVVGNIVEQTPEAVRIEANGAVMTYFADEVKDVDGRALSAPVQKPVMAKAQYPPLKPINATQPNTATDALNQLSTAGLPDVPMTPVSPEKRALIIEFMTVFGTKDALTQNFNHMMEQASKDKPEAAQKIKERIKVDEIIEELLPIYDHHFSSADLKAYIAFYSSPEGKKLVTTIPTMMQESVTVSIRYMQRKFPDLGGSKGEQ